MRPVPQPIGTPYGKPGTMWKAGHHTGTDFLAPVGTPVAAATAGRVVHASYGGGWGAAYGLHVVIESIIDGRAYQVLYAHLGTRLVAVGQTVTLGQIIGSSGATGNVTGPHLHFEVRVSPYRYGDDVNPQVALGVAPPAPPVKRVRPQIVRTALNGLRRLRDARPGRARKLQAQIDQIKNDFPGQRQ